MNSMPKITCFTLLIFLVSIASFAQKVEKFYDYSWKECESTTARFYSITTKTDSGYFSKGYYIKERRLKMIGNYLDSLCKVKNGSFAFYYANGVLESSGKYIQDKKEGLWISYHNNRVMRDSTVFSSRNETGKSLSWYPNGYPRDSTALNKDRSGVHVSWFDNGIPSAGGRYSPDMKQNGKWKYFHRNGSVSSIELYEDARCINKQYFNEKGEIMTDTTNTDRQAQFAGGEQAWLKNISDKIYFPHGYKISNADAAKVVVTFTVNENGDIENVFTSTPFDKLFDEIAENVVRKSPKWIPAREHNRNVKQVMYQPVSFNNYKD